MSVFSTLWSNVTPLWLDCHTTPLTHNTTKLIGNIKCWRPLCQSLTVRLCPHTSDKPLTPEPSCIRSVTWTSETVQHCEHCSQLYKSMRKHIIHHYTLRQSSCSHTRQSSASAFILFRRWQQEHLYTCTQELLVAATNVWNYSSLYAYKHTHTHTLFMHACIQTHTHTHVEVYERIY